MGLEKAGRVVKSLSPGAPGTKQWQERYRDRLVRVRSTTVEIVVKEAYWDPEGYQAYKLAMFNNGHSI